MDNKTENFKKRLNKLNKHHQALKAYKQLIDALVERMIFISQRVLMRSELKKK